MLLYNERVSRAVTALFQAPINFEGREDDFYQVSVRSIQLQSFKGADGTPLHCWNTETRRVYVWSRPTCLLVVFDGAYGWSSRNVLPVAPCHKYVTLPMLVVADMGVFPARINLEPIRDLLNAKKLSLGTSLQLIHDFKPVTEDVLVPEQATGYSYYAE